MSRPEPEPKVPPEKVAEARTLWEIALRYIGLSAASRAYAGEPTQQAAASGYRAAQLLARAYYRLARAMWTGATIADRTDPPGRKTSLKALYSDFETLAYRSIPKSKHQVVRERVAMSGNARPEEVVKDILPSTEKDADLGSFVAENRGILVPSGKEFSESDGGDYAAEETSDPDWSDLKDILVEALSGARKHLEAVQAEEEDAYTELARKHRERAKKLREERAHEEAEDRERDKRERAESEEERRRFEASLAGEVLKTAHAGARAEISSVVQNDDRAVGFVRRIHSPYPCAFCMMLASRGIVLYRSKKTALAFWHPNCQCTAEPVFSYAQYYSDPAFEQNRALYYLWKDIPDYSLFRSHYRQMFEKKWDNKNGQWRARPVTFQDLIRANRAKHRGQST